jgi:hypothetical protein
MGSLLFANRGLAWCFLKGQPQVSLIDAQGNVIPTTSDTYPFPTRGPGVVFLQPTRPGSEAPDSLAWVGLSWKTHDENGGCQNPLPPARAIRVRVGASAGVTLDLARDFPPYGLVACGRSLGLTWYQPFELQPTPAQLSLAASLNAPTSARAGDVLRYTVTLRNTSSEPVTFGPSCPAFVQVLTWRSITGVKDGVKDVYLLNCTPVASIAAGAAVSFAMELPVPVLAQPGPATIEWLLIGSRSQESPSAAQLTISG